MPRKSTQADPKKASRAQPRNSAGRVRKRSRILKRLSELSLTMGGDPDEVFDQAVRIIGELFAVKVVCLSQIVGPELHFKSVYVNGLVVRDAGRCPLSVTPCATVEMTKNYQAFDRVMERFPEASFLKDHRAFSYCGFPALDHSGKVVAITCLLDETPHEFTEEDQDLLRLFGQRIAAEIVRARDLAERKRMADQLRASESRLEFLLSTTPAVIYSAKTTGDYGSTFVSDNVTKILGYGSNEFIADPGFWADRIHPDDRERVFASLRHILEPEELVLEYRFLHKNGTYRWMRDEFRVICDTDGRPIELVGCWTDNTERKQAEDALCESEGMYRRIVETATEGIWQIDEHNVTTFVNRQMAGMLGYRIEEMMGRSLYDFMNEEAIPIARSAVERRRQGVAEQHEFRFQRKDGTSLWTWISANPFIDGTGRYTGALALVSDITQSKSDREQIKAAEQQLRNVMDSLLVFVGLFSPDSVFLDANRAAFEAAELSREDAIGRRYRDTYWASDLPEACAMVEDAIARAAHGEIVRTEVPVRVAPDRVLTMDAFFNPIYDHNGHVSQVIGSGIDITERKQAELALQRSKVRLQEAQRLALIGNWELDLTSNHLIWSDEIFQIFEIDSTRFNASYDAFLNAVHPDDRVMVNEAYTTSVRERKPYEIIHRLLMPDGRIKYVQEHCETDYHQSGRPIRSRGTVQDITVRRLAELRTETSLREKETLLREVHHRVKNNLQIISSLLYFQSKKIRDIEDLAVFRDGQDRLKSMILVHEKLYGSENLARVDFADYVRTLVNSIRQSYAPIQEKVDLVIDVPPLALPMEIAMPAGMIMNELLANTFKYAFPGDRAGMVRISVTPVKEALDILVEDTGVGFPEGIDPERPATFGLQLIHGLTSQLGGRIAFGRERGQGASVRVHVPIPVPADAVSH